MNRGKIRKRAITGVALLVPILLVLGLVAWGVGGQLSPAQVAKLAGFVPIVVVSAVVYDYTFHNAHQHLTRCALLGFAAAFITGTWGASLLTPGFTASAVLFGLVSGVLLAISLIVGAWRKQREQRQL